MNETTAAAMLEGEMWVRDAINGFADLLEREAGHTLIAFVLLGIGLAFWKFGQPKADDVIILSLGYLGRSMGTAVAGTAASALRATVKP